MVCFSLNKLKSAKRRLERAWFISHSSDDLKLLRSATNHIHAAVIKAKRNSNISLISSQVTNPRQLWKTANKLLHRTLSQVLPPSESPSLLSQSFATLFSDKIHKLHTSFSAIMLAPLLKFLRLLHCHISLLLLLSLWLKSLNYYLILLNYLWLGSYPHFSPKAMLVSPSPYNHQYHQPLSLSTSIFPDQFKNCSVHPHLKKPIVLKDKFSQTIVAYHISPICLNSLKELSKPVTLNIYLITISSTLSSQPTSKGIPLKLLHCLSMTTSSKLWVFSKLLVLLSLTYLLLSTPLITPSHSNVYHLGLESLRMLYLG